MRLQEAREVLRKAQLTQTEEALLHVIGRQQGKIVELNQRLERCENALRRMDAALVPLQGGFKL